MFDRHRGDGQRWGWPANDVAGSGGRKSGVRNYLRSCRPHNCSEWIEVSQQANAGGTQLDKDSIGQKETSFSSTDSFAWCGPGESQKKVSTCSDYSGHDNHCDARRRPRWTRCARRLRFPAVLAKRSFA